MIYRLLLNIFLLWVIPFVASAERSVPLVSYFSPFDSRSGDSNWGVAQDQQGRVYLANRSGLLEYDGLYWALHSIPSTSKLVRSVYADHHTGRIFIGAFEEFGYFERQPNGEMSYTSLSLTMEGYMLQNDEIWNILAFDGKIYFQSFTSFFVFDGKNVTPVKNDGDLFLFFFRLKDGLFTYEEHMGIARLDPQTNLFAPIPTPHFSSRVITAFDAPNGEQVIVTEKSGIFLVTTHGEARRLDDFGTDFPLANRAIRTQRGEYIIGTIDRGVYCINQNGQKVWHINDQNGLVNNTVLNLMEDVQGNVWVALSKGVALIRNNSPFRSLSFVGQSIGSIFSAQKINNRYYIGTNRGLFEAPEGDISHVRHVSGVTHQVWEIAPFDNQLLIGTNKETFSLTAGVIKTLSPASGGMTFKRATINGQEVIIGATYCDICIYRRDSAGHWKLSHSLSHFCQPIRRIEVDYQGNLWCAHLRKGLYCLTLDNTLTKIIENRYYPAVSRQAGSEEFVNVNKLGNRVVFSNDSLFYFYNEHENRIVPYVSLNDQLSLFKGAGRIIPLPHNRYWVIKTYSAALIRWEAERVTVERVVNLSSLKSIFVENEQNIIPLGNGKHLFCLENQFAVYDENFHPDPTSSSPQLFISSVSYVNSRNEISRPSITTDRSISLPINVHSIVIRCAFTDHSGNFPTEIRYRLYRKNKLLTEGFMMNRQLLLPSLKQGDYQVVFNALNDDERTLSTCSLRFSQQVHPFSSVPAIVLYILFVVSVLTWVYRRKKRKLIEKFHNLQLEHERLQHEMKMRRENEKLSSELSHKGKELSSYALLQMRHNVLLENIRKEVMDQKVAMGVLFPKKNFQRLLSLIDSDSSTKNEWKVFEQNFDLIHEHFFRTLKTNYPELTPNDLRLCGYLRLNIPSKEIAQLLNISLKGVEVARHRLRKKLNLEDNQNLVYFMISVRGDQHEQDVD